MLKYPTASPKIAAEILKDIIKDKVVFDIGAGEGQLLEQFKKYAKKVSGIEIDPERQAECQKNGIEVILGDILKQELPLADIYYLQVNSGLREKILSQIEGQYKFLILGITNMENLPNPLNKYSDIVINIPIKDKKDKKEFKLIIIKNDE